MDRSDYVAIWMRFDELAALSDEDRAEEWRKDGMSFVAALASAYLTDSEMPKIESAEEFSEFIVVSRKNCRLWNQRLMSLMISFDGEDNSSRVDPLHEFMATCPWKQLTEAAGDFIDSKS